MTRDDLHNTHLSRVKAGEIFQTLMRLELNGQSKEERRVGQFVVA